MDLVDIKDWASSEIKTIVVSQIFLDAPYPVKVKEFVPVEGDMLEEKWTSGNVVKSHRIPRYAIANMEETAQMLVGFIELHVADYIVGILKPQDDLLFPTYFAAFQHAKEAKVCVRHR